MSGGYYAAKYGGTMQKPIGLLCAVVFALSAAVNVQATTLDQLVHAYAEQRDFSGVVLVARDGQPIYQAAFGMAQPAWKVAVTDDSVFRIGSLSKPLTATLVMRLVEIGRIKLDETVGSYLPAAYAGTDAGKITVRQLLAHTSGLADVPSRYTDTFWSRDARLHYTPKEFASAWIPGALASEPGSWRYNNIGYYLLGMIVEAATGKSYAENMKQYIFAPAGMQDSGLFDGRTIIPKLAQGTVQADDGTRVLPSYIDPSVSYSAAGLYSTALDMVRFDSALTGGRLLSQTSQREMFANRGKGYGYGWEVEDWAVRTDTPLPVVLHTGSIPGYQSIFVRSLSDHVAIVVLDNTWQGATVVAMARDIADLVHGKPVALPRRSLQAALGPILFREGLDAMRAAYLRLGAHESTMYDVSESALNAFGYSLLRKGQREAAIQVFRWNAEAYPLSPNVHDSLAEALLASGNREGARAGYAKVLALDPGNRHATEELEKLRPTNP